MSHRMWDRWIALLLRAYPRAFRARFGDDLRAQYPPPDSRRGRAALQSAREIVPAGLGARADDRRRARTSRDRTPGAALVDDARRAARAVARRPSFTLMVALTLALAAGLNTAVFGILDTTLLRPLPYADERGLVSIGLNWNGFRHASVSLPEFVDFDERAASFSSMAVFSSTSINLAATGGTAERIQGARVTASFFEVLGVAPSLGRVFTPEEDLAGERVVVLSHAFWSRRYGADPGIVGADLQTDGGPGRILGVMPPDFAMPSDATDVWIPMNLVPGDAGSRGAHNRQVIARLASGVSIDAASREMDRIAADLGREYPDSYPAGSGFGVSVRSLRNHLVGDLRAPLQVLMLAVALVLLIACANVANLMVARASERGRELVTRMALGASRPRLIREAALEGLLTGALGGVAGLLFAAWLVNALGAWLPDALPRPDAMLTDARVAGFAVLVTSLACALTSALSVFGVTRLSITAATRGTRVTADTQRARTVLTAVQIALSVTLLASGGFAMRSFARLMDTHPGIRTDSIATARVSLSSARYPDDADEARFFQAVMDRLDAQPGVAAAGAISMLPLSGQTSDWTFGVEGWVPPSPGIEPGEQSRVVAGDYFRLVGIPLVAGRLFEDRDTSQAPRVAIVSELLAKKYWADGNPIGRRIRLWGVDSDEPWTTVVGIVGDIRHLSLDEAPVPFLYFPASQVPSSTMTLLARLDNAADGPQVIATAVRAVDVEQPTWAPRMMDEWLTRTAAEPRFQLLLLGVFAGLAVLLAAVGIYGVMAFGVSRRTRELGIRAALGAVPGSLGGVVLREGLTLAAFGIAAGLAAAVAAARLLSASFHDVRPGDPLILVGVPALVLVIAALASYLPARRAMRVDPAIALRAEG